MSTDCYQPGLHRFAVATAFLALLPITVGALVTTMGAGMAFLDWPSSDGHNILLYPWIQSFVLDVDKFVEHGHRLAGITIGLVSIALAIFFGVYEKRGWARWLGFAVLLLVCAQGLLGGRRVQLVSPDLAMLHGLFGSWVFAFICSVALMTSKGWHQASEFNTDEWTFGTVASACLAVVAVETQYVLGGMLRHHGAMVLEHMGMAFLVLLSIMWVWVGAYCTGVRWLRSNANWLAVAGVCQIMLGLLTYVAKFGFGNDVAVVQSLFQMWTRTSHTVLGMFVWTLAVTYLIRICRIMWTRHKVAGINSTVQNSGPALDRSAPGVVAPSTGGAV